jgi:hypothetical protein
MGVLLWLIAWLLAPICEILNFITVLWIYKKQRGFFRVISTYSRNMAIDRDRYGNYNYRTGLNFWFSNGGIEYGNEKETISYTTGIKSIEKTLSLIGWCFYYFLYAIDFTTWKTGGHCFAATISKTK